MDETQLTICPPARLLSSVEVRERMRSVFTRGLENHLTQEEMEPCRAVATRQILVIQIAEIFIVLVTH